MKNKLKVSQPTFRISNAAVGRHLASIILRAEQGELSRERFADTINAVYECCLTGYFNPDPSGDVDMDVLAAEWREIEKSIRRSDGARRAAARRRKLREEKEREAEELARSSERLSIISDEGKAAGSRPKMSDTRSGARDFYLRL